MSNGQHQSLFQPDLLKDEEILWSGQPDPSVHFNRADRFWIPVGLSNFLIGLVMHFDLVTESTTLFFPIFSIILITIGVFMLVVRFIFKSWSKRRTFYAITNRRALVLRDSRARKVHAVYLSRIPVTEKTVRADGVGTVYFGTPELARTFQYYGNTGMEWPSPFATPEALAFYDIRGVDGVYDLANRLC
jgi:hypothetical protein